MTTLQHVVLKMEMDYLGHPYYVTGNALLHAIADDLDYHTQRQIAVSHGVFTPGQYGVYPDEHSNSGGRPNLGASAIEIESYDDLWLHRQAQHNWLLDSRARDALNTTELRVQSGKPGIAPTTTFDKSEQHRYDTQTTTWYIHAYLTSDADGVLPLETDRFDGIHLGGKRNYGYGEVRIKDTQIVNLEEVDYSRLNGVETYLIELVTPFVVETEYPDADDRSIPWWWAENREDLRFREEKLLEQREVFRLETIDHGQVVTYLGDRPVETAKNGLQRVGSHSRYGFGELRLEPLGGQYQESKEQSRLHP